MSTTVNYKGSTLTTVNNQTRVLNTAGKWLEGDITLIDVTSGSTPSVPAHTLYWEFVDETNLTETVYYSGTFISDAIRATTPTIYNNKTVTLAQLDGVTWYSYTPQPDEIPLNTQLIDYTAGKSGYILDGDNGEEVAQESGFISDYTEIDPTMTFTYIGYRWWNAAFYDSSKTYISGFRNDAYIGTIDEYDFAHGTLTPTTIPSNAKYIRITTAVYGADSSGLSLIRTA